MSPDLTITRAERVTYIRTRDQQWRFGLFQVADGTWYWGFDSALRGPFEQRHLAKRDGQQWIEAHQQDWSVAESAKSLRAQRAAN